METHSLIQKLNETKKFIESKTKIKPRLGYVLGSGLGHFADIVENRVSIPYSEIPHFYAPSVVGHHGELIVGNIGKTPVAVLKGRIHLFEGHPVDRVIYPVRTLAKLGVETVFLTNAAGGMLKMKVPGMMVITDQINLSGTNALIGQNIEELGPRFPDMSEAFDKKLTKDLVQVLTKNKIPHKKGIYIGLSGPTYETPAEISYLKKIGGGAVGMSTVNEVIALRHMGVKCVGISCITNAAAGIQKTPLNHEEVTENAKLIEKQFITALSGFAKSYRA